MDLGTETYDCTSFAISMVQVMVDPEKDSYFVVEIRPNVSEKS